MGWVQFHYDVDTTSSFKFSVLVRESVSNKIYSISAIAIVL